MNVQAFTPMEINNNLAPTGASSSITFTGGGVNASSLLIANVGVSEAFVRWGVGAQTALTSDQSVPAGAVMVFTKGNTANTVAAVTAGGTTNLRISAGEGQ